MSVKIVKNPVPAWEPVTVEITFETRDQLYAFLRTTGNASRVASELGKIYNEVRIENGLNDLISYSDWTELDGICRRGDPDDYV